MGSDRIRILLAAALVVLSGCATVRSGELYKDEGMDFGSIQTVAVMPLANLSRETVAAERVRDIFIARLLATGAIYVLPPGEVARGIGAAGIQNPTAPSPDEVKKLAALVKANAVVTGTVREYGEVRSGNSASNVISVSMQMMESQLGKVVWAGSATKGGITFTDRLFGGGGKPMNDISVRAVDDLLDKLFR